MIVRTARAIGLGGMALAMLAGTAAPLYAQDGSDETRIRKLEAEVQAIQRKVFPGADGRFFEPEISAQPQGPATAAAPTATAVTDILARLDALETQLQRLTAQTEESANGLQVLTERVEALEGAPAEDGGDRVVSSNLSAMTGETSAPPAAQTPEAPPVAVTPDPQRLAAVQAIAKPQTDDPGDDEYSYGFRLWEAGLFPEAQQQLTLFVEKYPDHSRTTYGRNLLGRAYLDGNKPREAAPWFLKNYQTDGNGERAGDSLLYLAEAMIAMDDTSRACIALAEFSETYPALAAGRLQDEYAANRAKVTCN